MSTRHWIGVVSRSHVLLGVAGNFAQVCHGKKSAISRLGEGDWLIYYSPKTEHPNGEKCQRFTALGQVKTGDVYQVVYDSGFEPYRIDVKYEKVEEVPIADMKGTLHFTNGKNWGVKLRSGLLEITKPDFEVIYREMCGADNNLS